MDEFSHKLNDLIESCPEFFLELCAISKRFYRERYFTYRYRFIGQIILNESAKRPNIDPAELVDLETKVLMAIRDFPKAAKKFRTFLEKFRWRGYKNIFVSIINILGNFRKSPEMAFAGGDLSEGKYSRLAHFVNAAYKNAIHIICSEIKGRSQPIDMILDIYQSVQLDLEESVMRNYSSLEERAIASAIVDYGWDPIYFCTVNPITLACRTAIDLINSGHGSPAKLIKLTDTARFDKSDVALILKNKTKATLDNVTEFFVNLPYTE